LGTNGSDSEWLDEDAKAKADDSHAMSQVKSHCAALVLCNWTFKMKDRIATASQQCGHFNWRNARAVTL